MFNRSRGMIWYRILHVFLIFWMISALRVVVLGPDIAGVSPEDFYAAFPVYVNICKAQSAILIFIYLCFFISLVKYDIHMLMWCKILIVCNVLICVSQPMIASICYGVSFESNFTSYILVSLIVSNLAPFASYIYLKRRWVSGIPVQTSIATTAFDPFAEVPAKLMGHTDQAERDRIIADVMHGHPNPYTGFTISNEADWNTYLTMYYERKDAASSPSVTIPPEPCTPIDSIAPVSLSKNPPQTIDSDEVSMPQAEPQPEPKQIRFCRFCGNALRDDSIYCDKCGKKVRS